MPKTIHSPEYRQLIDDLRQRRLDLGMTQSATARALGWGQQKLSYAESSARRVDVIEYIHWARGLGLTPAKAFAMAERRIAAAGRPSRKRPTRR